MFGNQETQYVDVIKEMLHTSLTDQTYDVRFTRVKAAGNYLLLHEKDSGLQKHQFKYRLHAVLVHRYRVQVQTTHCTSPQVQSSSTDYTLY